MTLTPPPLDGPSVAALRAFEAAARLESFSRAADELHVTPAAVAQHVKSIEAWAGQPLFERTARGVRLNEAGRRARLSLTDAFHALGSAANRLRDNAAGATSLRIAALPAIAELWLTPRLSELREVVPDADISVHAVDRRPDVERDGFDMVAWYEPSDAGSDELVLVVAPELAPALTTIGDLAGLARLRDLVWDHHWSTWIGDDTTVIPTCTIDVSLFSMAVDAARRGHGALVGRHSLLADDLRRGTLVEPFDRRVATADTMTIRLRDELVDSRLGDWATRTLDSA